MRFRVHPHTNAIVLLAKVTGLRAHRDAKLLLDTGAAHTLFRPGILEDIGTETRGKIILAGIGGLAEATEHSIVGLSVHGLEIPIRWVVGRKLPAQIPIDGLLGLDALRTLKLELDLANGYGSLAEST